MGVISDAIDALEDWCKDLFKDGITSQFDGISDLLTDTFDQTTGSGSGGGLVSDFITQHPASFTGGVTGGSTIWTTIETLCNNVVVPIGGFILTVILLNELCQMVLRGNNFKDFDDSIFIKWIIKALCGVILVANTYYIASALFSFGTNVCSSGLATLFGSGSYLSTPLAINPSALSGLSLGELMTVWFISLIVHLGVMILIVAIVITLASRIIEVFMYLSIAPNREKKKITRYYIDEFHLLLKEEQTAKYSAEIWKRFRKWGGCPTGITQNVKDLLSSQEVENIFDNSDFVYMLNQAAGDRDILAEKLHISKEQMKYVTNSGPGEGLIDTADKKLKLGEPYICSSCFGKVNENSYYV